MSISGMAHLVFALCFFYHSNRIIEVYHLSKDWFIRLGFRKWIVTISSFSSLVLFNSIYQKIKFGEGCCLARYYACVGVETQTNQNPNISISFFSGQNLNSGAPRLLVLIPQPKIHAIYKAGSILTLLKANSILITKGK